MATIGKWCSPFCFGVVRLKVSPGMDVQYQLQRPGTISPSIYAVCRATYVRGHGSPAAEGNTNGELPWHQPSAGYQHISSQYTCRGAGSTKLLWHRTTSIRLQAVALVRQDGVAMLLIRYGRASACDHKRPCRSRVQLCAANKLRLRRHSMRVGSIFLACLIVFLSFF